MRHQKKSGAVAVGFNKVGQCDVGDWSGIKTHNR